MLDCRENAKFFSKTAVSRKEMCCAKAPRSTVPYNPSCCIHLPADAGEEQLCKEAMFHCSDITKLLLCQWLIYLDLSSSIRSALFLDLYQEPVGLIYGTDLC